MSDTDIFDKNTALALLDNDEELFLILVDSFLLENKFEKSVIEDLILKGKKQEAASYVHATKGAARQLCMNNLKNSGQRLEDVLRGKAEGNIPELIAKMIQDYEIAVSALKKQLN